MVFRAVASSVVCFAVVPFPFRSRPATPAVRGRVLIGGLPSRRVCAFFNCIFFAFFWFHNQTV